MPIVPRPYEIGALRRRHKISRKELAESLYGIEPGTIQSYELGRRRCHPLTWWAMVLTWDKIDLWADEEEWVDKFRRRKDALGENTPQDDSKGQSESSY